MKLYTFRSTKTKSNTYLLYIKEKAYIIDCVNIDMTKVLSKIKMDEKKLTTILITHGHWDHIIGIKQILKEYPNIRIYFGKEDKELLIDPVLNLSYNFNEKIIYDSGKLNIKFITGNKLLSKLGISESFDKEIIDMVVLDLPGHSRGSKGYYFKDEKICFTGDTIFSMGKVSKTTFPTSNLKDLEQSIGMLKLLPENTKIYPGHLTTFTIGKFKTIQNTKSYEMEIAIKMTKHDI